MLRPSSRGVHTFSSSTEWSYTQPNICDGIQIILYHVTCKIYWKANTFFDSWFQNPGKSSTWFRILWYFSVLVQQTLLTSDILQEPEINHIILGQLNYLSPGEIMQWWRGNLEWPNIHVCGTEVCSVLLPLIHHYILTAPCVQCMSDCIMMIVTHPTTALHSSLSSLLTTSIVINRITTCTLWYLTTIGLFLSCLVFPSITDYLTSRPILSAPIFVGNAYHAISNITWFVKRTWHNGERNGCFQEILFRTYYSSTDDHG